MSDENTSFITIFLQYAKTEFYDDIFKYWEKVVSEFYQVGRTEVLTKSRSDGSIVSVKVRMDQRAVIYGRVSD